MTAPKLEHYYRTIPLPSWFNASGVPSPLPGLKPIATVTVPVRTVSEANRHEHWRYRQKRAKEQRAVVTLLLQVESHANVNYGFPPGPFPFHVHMTRLASRKLDSDNLAGALKHCRDAVAKFLGVDDGDETKVTWSVGQEKAKGYAVRCEFYRRDAR